MRLIDGYHVALLGGARAIPSGKPIVMALHDYVNVDIWVQESGNCVAAVRFDSEKYAKKNADKLRLKTEIKNAVNAAVQLVFAIVEAVVPFKSYSNDSTSPWSFSGTDGDDLLGDSEKKNWKRFKAAHAYVAGGGTPETKGSYKLPHHKLKDGKIVTYLKGVQAAANAMAGARQKIDIPSADRKGVIRHLGRHLKEFGKELPPSLKKETKGPADEDLVTAGARFAEARRAVAGILKP